MKPVALVVESEFYPPDSLRKLAEKTTVITSKAITQEQLRIELLQTDAEILLCGLGITINQSLLDMVANIKFLVSPATGTNHLDINYLESRNIKVIHLGQFTDQISNVFSTAELTWSLLLAVVRKIIPAQTSVTLGNFDRGPFLGIDLSGRTLGIIGFGRLGRRVADYGLAFGMRVIVCDTDEAKISKLQGGVTAKNLDELLEMSDVVTVHAPLNSKTEGLLDRAKILKIKPGAVLINTSRGELVDEVSIVEALKTGKLYGFGTDVLVGENAENFSATDSPLVKAALQNLNVVVTPHIGGWTKDAVSTTRSLVVDELLRQL